jgi:peptidoglycan/xylan/chitin deacetylase (PgdA/CDA1 family)
MRPVALLGSAEDLTMWVRAMGLWGLPFEHLPAGATDRLDPNRFGAAVLVTGDRAGAVGVEDFVAAGGHLLMSGGMSGAVARLFPGIRVERERGRSRCMQIGAGDGWMRWREGEVLAFTCAPPDCDDEAVREDTLPVDAEVLARSRVGPGGGTDGPPATWQEDPSPTLVLRRIGVSRVLYLPIPIGKAERVTQPDVPTFTEYPCPVANHALLVLIRDLIAYLCGPEAFDWPGLWPDGARCAVCITGDVHDYTGIGLPERADREHRDMVDYMDILAEQGMAGRATFFVSGQVAASHPDAIREGVRRGHELCPHTFSDCCYSSAGLGYAEQRRDIERCIGAFAAAVPGHASSRRGFRTHGYSSNQETRRALSDLGYDYIADLQSWDPNHLGPLGKSAPTRYLGLPQSFPGETGEQPRLLEVPDSIANDHFLYRVYGRTPEQTLEYYRTRFDDVYRLGGLFLVNFHPYISLKEGPGREETFRQIIRHVKSHPDIALLRVDELAGWWRERIENHRLEQGVT